MSGLAIELVVRVANPCGTSGPMLRSVSRGETDLDLDGFGAPVRRRATQIGPGIRSSTGRVSLIYTVSVRSPT